MEQTFVMVKPAHVDISDRILSDLDFHAKRVLTGRVDAVPLETVEAHYAPHLGKDFYPRLLRMFEGNPVVIARYEGHNVIKRLRAVIGPTDPFDAPAHTIRGRYGTDRLETAIEEDRSVENVVHASDLPESFAREDPIWEPWYGMRIFVVGSKHVYDQMPPVIADLKRRYHTVMPPNSFEDPMSEESFKEMGREEHIAWKSARLREQTDKVAANDALLVMNLKKHGQPNYVGGATFLEISHAFYAGKQLFFWNPIPDCKLSDELTGMNPTVINGDLSLIRRKPRQAV